jgi:Ca2+-binding EF-hand superfamily protein
MEPTKKESMIERYSTAISEGLSYRDVPIKWSTKAFHALDSENRGYLYKDEILDHIKGSGTYTNKQLKGIVHRLEQKAAFEKITFSEFEEMISGRNFMKLVLENSLVVPMY